MVGLGRPILRVTLAELVVVVVTIKLFGFLRKQRATSLTVTYVCL